MRSGKGTLSRKALTVAPPDAPGPVRHRFNGEGRVPFSLDGLRWAARAAGLDAAFSSQGSTADRVTLSRHGEVVAEYRPRRAEVLAIRAEEVTVVRSFEEAVALAAKEFELRHRRVTRAGRSAASESRLAV